MTIEPDTNDWTWVLERPCPECSFDTTALDRRRLPQALRDNATLWQVVLGTEDAAVRPSPHVWSPLEYACHVRDVHRLFDDRLRRMLSEDDPELDNWDQDATATATDYGSQDPSTVAPEVVAAAEAVAASYEAVADDGWERPARRSDGARFTVDSFARYHLHDVVHHAHDVSHVTKRVTVDSYDADAERYRDGTLDLTPETAAALDAFAGALRAGARVLEIGSGGGRDALALEERGLSVRRTDIAPGFVRLLRAAGHDADVLDPLTDDVAGDDGPYDGVWASASLVHVRREDLPTVLERLAGATRPGGVLALAVKEGDGARFSTHGRVSGPRHFTFWREKPLRAALDGAGWQVVASGRREGERDTWLEVRAERR